MNKKDFAAMIRRIFLTNRRPYRPALPRHPILEDDGFAVATNGFYALRFPVDLLPPRVARPMPDTYPPVGWLIRRMARNRLSRLDRVLTPIVDDIHCLHCNPDALRDRPDEAPGCGRDGCVGGWMKALASPWDGRYRARHLHDIVAVFPDLRFAAIKATQSMCEMVYFRDGDVAGVMSAAIINKNSGTPPV